jgi:transcription antitermination factor NusB
MRKRTLAREYALQMLYEMDITQDSTERVIQNFWDYQITSNVAKEVKDFAEFLTRGVIQNLKDIDNEISKHSQNWKLKRMAVVDRNILRLGSFELLFCKDIPPKVSINEAIELAKKFSGQESARFVNGILDKIKEKRNSNEVC